MNGSPETHEITPIRQSIFIFAFKLFVVLFLIDTVYAAAGFLVLQFGIPQAYHYDLFTLFLIVHILKNLLQIYFALSVVLSWVGSVWYIHNRQLIKREGLLHVSEKVYDLTIIRSIDIDQGIMGKLFHYGSISLKTSASGGYNDQIPLRNIDDPEKFATILKTFLSS